MGGMGQAGQCEAAASQRHHFLRSTSDAASFAAEGHSALGQHASLLGSTRLWTITAAHTHGFSSPRQQPCLLPRRRGSVHPHLHGDTDSGLPACTSIARGWPAASPCRLTPGPCYGLGPNQALASSPRGTSGTCRRRGSGSGTASASARVLPDAVSSMRPAIWAAEYGDEHSGIRCLESQPELPQIIASSFSLSQMPQVLLASEEHQTHPLMPHGCILLSLVQLQSETDAHRSHSLQPAGLTPRQRVHAALRSDDIDIATLAEAHPSSSEWAHRAAQSAALDRPGFLRLLSGCLLQRKSRADRGRGS